MNPLWIHEAFCEIWRENIRHPRRVDLISGYLGCVPSHPAITPPLNSSEYMARDFAVQRCGKDAGILVVFQGFGAPLGGKITVRDRYCLVAE